MNRWTIKELIRWRALGRPVTAFAVASMLLASGCGSSDDSEASSDSAPSTLAAANANSIGDGQAPGQSNSEIESEMDSSDQAGQAGDPSDDETANNVAATTSTVTATDVIADGSASSDGQTDSAGSQNSVSTANSSMVPPASETSEPVVTPTSATTPTLTKPTTSRPKTTKPPTTNSTTTRRTTTRRTTTETTTTKPTSNKPTTTKRATTRPTTTRLTTTKPTTTKPTTTRPTSKPRSGAFFSVDFQRSPVGAYSDAQIRAEWGNVRYTQPERATIVDEGGNRFLRVKFPKGTVGPSGGAMWEINLGSNASDELYASYRVRFVGDFNPVLGGKLPGLSGGASNTGGDKPNGQDGWSARIMWRRGNGAVQYLYHPDQPEKWGEDLAWGRAFPKNQWVTVETRVKMNNPGRKDGVVQSWMNGQLVLNRTDIRYRDTNSFEIDRFMFNTFFGGSGSEWAPTKDEYIEFDDFVISPSPITH